MKVTIYLKNVEKGPTTFVYDIDVAEFKRLAGDFESFLKGGNPKDGVYMCNTFLGDSSIKTRVAVPLKFDKIAAIG